MVKLRRIARVPSDLQAAEISQCLWCGRAFRPRTTGGSAQRFCSTEHRQAFWIAARRWTIRALEAGLISVDCLKADVTSVHAAGAPFRYQGQHDGGRGAGTDDDRTL